MSRNFCFFTRHIFSPPFVFPWKSIVVKVSLVSFLFWPCREGKKKGKKPNRTYIVLEAGEFDLAVFTCLAPVGTEVASVIVVSQAGDLLSTLHSARNGIQWARQQMSLKGETQIDRNKTYKSVSRQTHMIDLDIITLSRSVTLRVNGNERKHIEEIERENGSG